MAAQRSKECGPSTRNTFRSGTDPNCYPLAADLKRLPEHQVARRLAQLWSLILKQLEFFEVRTAPKRPFTRKRIEREAAKPSPWASSADPFHLKPKLPSVSFFRTMVKRGLMTLDGRVNIINENPFAKQRKMKPKVHRKESDVWRSRSRRPRSVEACSTESFAEFVSNALPFDVNGLLHVRELAEQRDWVNPRRRRQTDALGQQQPTNDHRRGKSRRRSASPLYLTYPILDRRWQRRRSTERRSGQDRRKS